jgi:hypothetical protein
MGGLFPQDSLPLAQSPRIHSLLLAMDAIEVRTAKLMHACIQDLFRGFHCKTERAWANPDRTRSYFLSTPDTWDLWTVPDRVGAEYGSGLQAKCVFAKRLIFAYFPCFAARVEAMPVPRTPFRDFATLGAWNLAGPDDAFYRACANKWGTAMPDLWQLLVDDMRNDIAFRMGIAICSVDLHIINKSSRIIELYKQGNLHVSISWRVINLLMGPHGVEKKVEIAKVLSLGLLDGFAFRVRIRFPLEVAVATDTINPPSDLVACTLLVDRYAGRTGRIFRGTCLNHNSTIKFCEEPRDCYTEAFGISHPQWLLYTPPTDGSPPGPIEYSPAALGAQSLVIPSLRVFLLEKIFYFKWLEMTRREQRLVCISLGLELLGPLALKRKHDEAALTPADADEPADVPAEIAALPNHERVQREYGKRPRLTVFGE